MASKKKYYPEANNGLTNKVLEEEVLSFWQEDKTFEKSIKNREKNQIHNEIRSKNTNNKVSDFCKEGPGNAPLYNSAIVLYRIAVKLAAL